MKNLGGALFFVTFVALMPAVFAVESQVETVLGKVQQQIRGSNFLSYRIMRTQIDPDLENRIWKMSGTVWLKKVSTDTFFGANFHVEGMDRGGKFDYFYNGKNSYAVRHKDKKITIFHISDFPDSPHHPAKSRVATVLLLPLLVNPNFRDAVLNNQSSITIGESLDHSRWIVSITYLQNEYGQAITKILEIAKTTYRIEEIHEKCAWRGSTTVVDFVLGNYQSDKDVVFRHIAMPTDYEKGYSREVYKEKKSNDRHFYKKFVGKPAPAFKFNAFSGKKISLGQFKGKLVLLDFWETWCGYCLNHLPDLNALQKKWKGKLIVIGVVTENKEPVRKLIKNNKLVYTNIFADKSILKEYEVSSRPTYYLIDPKGTIICLSWGNLQKIETVIDKQLH